MLEQMVKNKMKGKKFFEIHRKDIFTINALFEGTNTVCFFVVVCTTSLRIEMVKNRYEY